MADQGDGGTQVAPADPSKRRRLLLVAALVLVLLAVMGVAALAVRGGSKPSHAAATISASRGGSVKLGKDFRVDFPQNGFRSDTRVSVTRRPSTSDLPLAESLGPAYDVNVGNGTLRTPASVTITFDPSVRPKDVNARDVFVARFDDARKVWEPLPTQLDESGRGATATVDHFTRLQAFYAKVREIAGAALDLYAKGLQVVGVRTAPPTCATQPSGVALDLVPKSTGGSGLPMPGGNFIHLVLGCVDSASGGKVKVKVANNRSYAQLLIPDSGLSVSIDHVDYPNISEAIAQPLEDLFSSKAVYLPANGEADLALGVSAGASRALEVETSQVALIVDGALRVLDLLVPETSKADAAKCVYAAAAAGNGQPPQFSDLGKIIKDCAGPLAGGFGAVVLGPVVAFIDLQMGQLKNQIDSSANAVLGGGEAVRVSIQRPAVDWRNTTYTTDCAGASRGEPFAVEVHDGNGTGASGGPQTYAVRVAGVVSGDLKGDGDQETFVLLFCIPQPSNFYTTEVQVLAADGQRLAVLRPPDLHPEGTGLSPEFDEQPFEVEGRRLLTAGLYYAAGGCHAGGPSIRHDLVWTWNRSAFTATPGPLLAGPGRLCTTPTSVPPAGSVLLAADGLGVVPLGTDMDKAIAAVTAALGPPDYTGDWYARYCQTAGPRGPGGRLVVWGRLSVMFSDGGLGAPGNPTQRQFVGQRVLWGYEYADRAFDQGAGRDVPVRHKADLQTPSGAGIGTTGSRLEQLYGSMVRSTRGDPSGFPGPTYFVTTSGGYVLHFHMDANGPDGRVSAISAGGSCGE